MTPERGWAKNILGASPEGDDLGFTRPKKIEAILSAVAAAFDLERGMLTASNVRSKNVELKAARNIGAYLLREDVRLSFADIASHMGWRNHTSAHDAHDQIGKILGEAKDDKFAQVLSTIREIAAQELKMAIDIPRNVPPLRM